MMEQSTEHLLKPKAGDSGFAGADEVNPLISFMTPFKKSKGKELAENQKQTNHVLSSVRVKVEHPLAYLKHFNILSHQFRNRIDKSHTSFCHFSCHVQLYQKSPLAIYFSKSNNTALSVIS